MEIDCISIVSADPPAIAAGQSASWAGIQRSWSKCMKLRVFPILNNSIQPMSRC